MVGNSIPVFLIRDAIEFPGFIHTQKRDPQTNPRIRPDISRRNSIPRDHKAASRGLGA